MSVKQSLNNLINGESDGEQVGSHLALFPPVLLHQSHHEGAAHLVVLGIVVLLQQTEAVLRVGPESVCRTFKRHFHRCNIWQICFLLFCHFCFCKLVFLFLSCCFFLLLIFEFFSTRKRSDSKIMYPPFKKETFRLFQYNYGHLSCIMYEIFKDYTGST